jgi:glycosyltransferase involved in cell wall biosynthesis
LLAARQLGLPFAYEMRGLWDMSRAAKIAEYENSDRYRLGMQLEALVAKEADRIFVITAALGEYITKEWGIDPAKVELLPNCVNPETIERAKKMAGPKPEVFTVGYAGSLLEYEGLDLLVDALAELKKRGTIVHARIIGEGPERKKLEQRAKKAGLNGGIEFLGRLTPDQARARLAETHAAVLPRRPSAVCQMVAPLKLIEARSLGLPLIFSDLPLLASEVNGHDRTEPFSAGDASSMAACLSTIAGSPVLSDSAPLPAGRFWRQHAASLLSAAHAPCSGVATGRPAPKVTSRGGAGFSDILTSKLTSEGPEAAAVYAISRADPDESFTAAELLLEQGHVAQAVTIGEAVAARHDALHVLRRGARLFHRAVDISKASALARRLAIVSSNPSDVRLVKEIMQTGQLHRAASEPPAAPAREPHPRKIINFLAFSLPYKTVGYATRSHGLARGIKNAGWDIVPYTRPGFPRDLAAGAPAGEIAEADTIEGITYQRIAEPLRRGRTENEYMTEAVAACAEAIRRENPAVVHAASNYVTALPALIAARRAGLPFVYEVRGFWEITRTSRDEEFSNTPKFRTMKLFESVLTSAADHIITLTSGMREEMVGQGMPAEKISIAYNGVDADLFQPRPRDEKLAAELRIGPGTTVIGYVGSFVDYEGLDDLLVAAAALKKSGKDFKLLMVGDGSAAPSLRQLAVTLEIQDRAIFTGRVPREHVEAYYSLIDIAPFPRKPWSVCELVSPLKPFEAMALEKLVVASDTKALAESITDGSNGLLFRKGDTASLTATLAKAFDTDLRSRLGAQARSWVSQNRTWDAAGLVCAGVYGRLLARTT